MAPNHISKTVPSILKIGPPFTGACRLMYSAVTSLRRKLGGDDDNPKCILSGPHVGYRMANGEPPTPSRSLGYRIPSVLRPVMVATMAAVVFQLVACGGESGISQSEDPTVVVEDLAEVKTDSLAKTRFEEVPAI